MIASAVKLAALVSGPEFAQAVLTHGAAAGVSPEEFPRLTASALRRRGAILDVCNALGAKGDEDDFYRTLAAIWLELRFEWQRHNLVSNYGTVRHGCAAPLSLALAGASSALMAQLESLLDDTALARLGEFAAQLIEGTHGVLSAEATQVSNAAAHAYFPAGS
jgi:hypothetical protein